MSGIGKRQRCGVLAAVILLSGWPAHAADEATLEALKAQLMEVVAEYEPGTPVTPELDAKVSEAARALEEATGETLFVKTGLLNFGPPGDPYLEKHMAVLRKEGRPWRGSGG